MENKIVIPKHERNYSWSNKLLNNLDECLLISLADNEIENPIIIGEERLETMEKS